MPGKSTIPGKLEALSIQLPNANISQIAALIQRDWASPNYAAIPYLREMGNPKPVVAMPLADYLRDMVLGFLANASTYRGSVAKLVKLELNRRLKAGA